MKLKEADFFLRCKKLLIRNHFFFEITKKRALCHGVAVGMRTSIEQNYAGVGNNKVYLELFLWTPSAPQASLHIKRCMEATISYTLGSVANSFSLILCSRLSYVIIDWVLLRSKADRENWFQSTWGQQKIDFLKKVSISLSTIELLKKHKHAINRKIIS